MQMIPVLRVWLFIAATIMSAQLMHDSPRSTVDGQNPAPVDEPTHVYPRAPSLILS